MIELASTTIEAVKDVQQIGKNLTPEFLNDIKDATFEGLEEIFTKIYDEVTTFLQEKGLIEGEIQSASDFLYGFMTETLGLPVDQVRQGDATENGRLVVYAQDFDRVIQGRECAGEMRENGEDLTLDNAYKRIEKAQDENVVGKAEDMTQAEINQALQEGKSVEIGGHTIGLGEDVFAAQHSNVPFLGSDSLLSKTSYRPLIIDGVSTMDMDHRTIVNGVEFDALGSAMATAYRNTNDFDYIVKPSEYMTHCKALNQRVDNIRAEQTVAQQNLNTAINNHDTKQIEHWQSEMNRLNSKLSGELGMGGFGL